MVDVFNEPKVKIQFVIMCYFFVNYVMIRNSPIQLYFKMYHPIL